MILTPVLFSQYGRSQSECCEYRCPKTHLWRLRCIWWPSKGMTSKNWKMFGDRWLILPCECDDDKKTLMDWRCVCVFPVFFVHLKGVPQWFLIEGVVTRSPVWNNHGFQRDKFLGQKKRGIHKICNRARSCLLGKNWLIECQLSMMSAW